MKNEFANSKVMFAWRVHWYLSEIKAGHWFISWYIFTDIISAYFTDSGLESRTTVFDSKKLRVLWHNKVSATFLKIRFIGLKILPHILVEGYVQILTGNWLFAICERAKQIKSIHNFDAHWTILCNQSFRKFRTLFLWLKVRNNKF